MKAVLGSSAVGLMTLGLMGSTWAWVAAAVVLSSWTGWELYRSSRDLDEQFNRIFRG